MASTSYSFEGTSSPYTPLNRERQLRIIRRPKAPANFKTIKELERTLKELREERILRDWLIINKKAASIVHGMAIFAEDGIHSGLFDKWGNQPMRLKTKMIDSLEKCFPQLRVGEHSWIAETIVYFKGQQLRHNGARKDRRRKFTLSMFEGETTDGLSEPDPDPDPEAFETMTVDDERVKERQDELDHTRFRAEERQDSSLDTPESYSVAEMNDLARTVKHMATLLQTVVAKQADKQADSTPAVLHDSGSSTPVDTTRARKTPSAKQIQLVQETKLRAEAIERRKRETEEKQRRKAEQEELRARADSYLIQLGRTGSNKDNSVDVESDVEDEVEDEVEDDVVETIVEAPASQKAAASTNKRKGKAIAAPAARPGRPKRAKRA